MRQVRGENIIKIELILEAWDTSSPEFSGQEERMFHYRGWFVSPNTPEKKQLFVNSVLSHAYDAVDVMDNNNYDTV